MNSLIKAGTIIKCNHKNVSSENGVYYIVKFLRTNWALFLCEEAIGRLHQWLIDGGTPPIVYKIMKSGKRYGMFIPRIANAGKHKGKIYLMSILVGQRKQRQYFIYNIDKDMQIKGGTSIYFNVESDF